jgi:DNA-binding IclR family transcriptional regulator
MPDQKHTIRSMETAFKIIDVLKQAETVRLTDLTSQVEFTKSTVHKHLQTLMQEGYVVKEADGYRLGLRFLEVGELARAQLELYETAKPEIDRLADETGELANLLIEEHGRGVYVYTAEGEDAVNLDTYPGKRVPMHGTALGKSILAYLPDDRVEAVLDRYGLDPITDQTLTDRDRLAQEFERIRERSGVAYEYEERVPGMSCVGAAVVTNDGSVHGAISVTGPVSRMATDRVENELQNKVRRAANIVAINLEYG